MRIRLPHTLIAATAATLAVAAPASADFKSGVNHDGIAPIDRVDNIIGTDKAHYPSTIEIDDLPGTITGVSVTIQDIRSTFPGDLDIVLVSPDGHATTLVSDVAGTNDVDGADLTFLDSASTSLPQSGALDTGIFKPTNYDGNDASGFINDFVPLGSFNIKPAATLAELNGGDPNGNWKLFVTDDQAGDLSRIGGWVLTVHTTGGAIRANSAPLTTPNKQSVDSAPAKALEYPSPIKVANLNRKLARVTVTLHDVAFGSAPDADLLLVGPRGQEVELFTDTGNPTEFVGGDITLDDHAIEGVPTGNPSKLGTFKPTDGAGFSFLEEPGGLDFYPAPAPPAPYGHELSALAGTDPNGEWKLYMTDDYSKGGINTLRGGWSLNLTLSDEPIEPPAKPADPEPQPQPQPEPTPERQPQPAPEPMPAPAPEPTPAPAPAPLPAPKAAPVKLSKLRLKPRTFKARKGTAVRYRLSGNAKVKFTVGRSSIKIKRNGHKGANKLRLNTKRLKPGRYVLKATAAGGNTRRVRFLVRR